MLFNIGIFHMIVGNVILDKEEEEHLTAIYRKYIDTRLDYDNKFFLDRQDIDFLLKMQTLTISCMQENIKLLKKNNKVLKSMLK